MESSSVLENQLAGFDHDKDDKLRRTLSGLLLVFLVVGTTWDGYERRTHPCAARGGHKHKRKRRAKGNRIMVANIVVGDDTFDLCRDAMMMG